MENGTSSPDEEETTLPTEFAELLPSDDVTPPEQRLMLGVLEEAIRSHQPYVRSSRQRDVRHGRRRFDARVRMTRRQAVGDDRAATLSQAS